MQRTKTTLVQKRDSSGVRIEHLPLRRRLISNRQREIGDPYSRVPLAVLKLRATLQMEGYVYPDLEITSLLDERGVRQELYINHYDY